ncbi:hypothetical protein V5799_022246, partial [Amblyomma americanum]
MPARQDDDRGLEAALLSALFLLTGLLFLVSLLGLYYSIAFSHGTRIKAVRNETTNLCEDIYTPLCSTVNFTCSGEALNETDFFGNLLTIARRKAQVLRNTMRGQEPIVPRNVNHMGVVPIYEPVKNTL